MARNVWKFRVKEGCEDEFIRMNNIDWPRLFGRSPEYRGTNIGRKRDDAYVYVTEDRWASREAFEYFLERNRADYDALDARHSGLYDASEHVGFFDD